MRHALTTLSPSPGQSRGGARVRGGRARILPPSRPQGAGTALHRDRPARVRGEPSQRLVRSPLHPRPLPSWDRGLAHLPQPVAPPTCPRKPHPPQSQLPSSQWELLPPACRCAALPAWRAHSSFITPPHPASSTRHPSATRSAAAPRPTCHSPDLEGGGRVDQAQAGSEAVGEEETPSLPGAKCLEKDTHRSGSRKARKSA